MARAAPPPQTAPPSLRDAALAVAARVARASLAPVPAPAPAAAAPAASDRAAVTAMQDAAIARLSSLSFSSFAGAGSAPSSAPPPPQPARKRRRGKSEAPAVSTAPGIERTFTTHDGGSLGRLATRTSGASLLAYSGSGGISGGARAVAPSAAAATVAPTALLGHGGGSHLAAPLLTGKAAPPPPTAGAGWFDMPAPRVTLEVTRELTILRNRSFLDPKRHYKSAREDRAKKLPQFFALGTVFEAPNERRSRAGRLTNAERAPSLVAGLLADSTFAAYAGRTVAKVQRRAEAGGKKEYRARKKAAAADWKKERRAYKSAQEQGGAAGGKRKRLY